MEGKMPKNALKLIFEWLELHKKELLKNWQTIQKTGDYAKIEPLKQKIMIMSVVKANYIKDYELEIVFDSGISSVIDLKNTIFNDHRKIFEALRDKNYFKNFSLDG